MAFRWLKAHDIEWHKKFKSKINNKICLKKGGKKIIWYKIIYSIKNISYKKRNFNLSF
jgi:hypothetical protein